MKKKHIIFPYEGSQTAYGPGIEEQHPLEFVHKLLEASVT